MKQCNVRSFTLIIALLLSLPSLCYALDLSQAKVQGLVGEKADGYLAAVQASPSSDVQALVGSINRERQQKYQEIAKKRGTSVSAVEALAGQTAIEKTSPGNFVLVGGKWQKK